MAKTNDMNFLERTKEAMDVLGFWTEDRRSGLIKSIERSYVDSIIKEWEVTDLVINGDKVLLKWQRRIIPLTDQEVHEQYRK